MAEATPCWASSVGTSGAQAANAAVSSSATCALKCFVIVLLTHPSQHVIQASWSNQCIEEALSNRFVLANMPFAKFERHLHRIERTSPVIQQPLVGLSCIPVTAAAGRSTAMHQIRPPAAFFRAAGHDQRSAPVGLPALRLS